LKKFLKSLAVVSLLVSLLTGCAVNRATASVDPSAKLDALKTLFVVQVPEDERGVGKLIADKFRSMGYETALGATAPGPVDAIVTYVDKWWWDITMYMIELTIVVREPRTDFPLATGNSMHTSLTRKSPPEMVNEVVTNIMQQGKQQ
jgi:hypothetical protein